MIDWKEAYSFYHDFIIYFSLLDCQTYMRLDIAPRHGRHEGYVPDNFYPPWRRVLSRTEQGLFANIATAGYRIARAVLPLVHAHQILDHSDFPKDGFEALVYGVIPFTSGRIAIRRARTDTLRSVQYLIT